MTHLIILLIVIALLGGCAPARTTSSHQAASSETAVDDPSLENANPMSEATLSPDLQTTILTAIAEEQSRAPDQLQITTAEAADWPDACLGLAAPDELCAQMLTPGWAIAVTDGEQTWHYRTDLDAIQIRQADTPE